MTASSTMNKQNEYQVIIIIIIIGQFIKRRNIAEVITRALNKKLKQFPD